jgi:hypothetical protein
LQEVGVGFVDAAAGTPGEQAGRTFHQRLRAELCFLHGGVEVGQPLQITLLPSHVPIRPF